MTKQKSPKLTVEDHLKNAPQCIVELFTVLDGKISDWNNVQWKVRGNYIGYWFVSSIKKSKLFVEVHIQSKKVKLHIGNWDYKNPSGIIITEVPDTHKWALTKLVDLDSKSNIDSVINLVKQSYDNVL